MRKILFILILTFSMFSCTTKPEETMLKALLLTGNDHPAHNWEETTPAIKEILELDSAVEVTVTRNPNRLTTLDSESYDFLILNYCNWEDPEGLSEPAKKGLINFLEQGGGLLVLHFANGAFHHSLQNAGDSDWPEYRNIVHQVWDHTAGSAHDDYGDFDVIISEKNHFITEGIENFITEDELYFNLISENEFPSLYSAFSVKSGKEEPLAWAYTYKNARVFQSLLGHSLNSYSSEEYKEILRRSAIWISRKD